VNTLLVGCRNEYVEMLLREMIGAFPEIHTDHVDRHTLSVKQSTELAYIVTTMLVTLTC